MKFYFEDAPKQAGARMNIKDVWQNNVVEDRELITGQNPMSAATVGEKLVAI